MQVIIPLAGKGTRLRPHTHTVAKPLVRVAGKPVLAHILDMLKPYKIDEIIFIVGHLGDQIEEFVSKHYRFNARYIVQQELKGQAHAIALARPYVNQDVLIWFVDTISDADISKLSGIKNDGMIFVKEVEDPRRFGVVVADKDGIVTQIIEKPENPTSNLVNIGLYYIKDSKLMFSCIDELMEKGRKTKGEFYLMDAFTQMIRKGAKFETCEVNVWEDCGKTDTLLATNRYFLDHGNAKTAKTKNSVIIPPVYIDDAADIENSIIGPYVSIAAKSVIRNSIIKDSIINEHAVVESAKLKQSIIGDNALVKGLTKRLNVGDSSEIILS
ncbi:MAG: sugar phosphate nucleotidyltransferase [archaeon]